VRLANPDALLKPGMNAEVAVEIATRRDVVTVPNGAVLAPREASSAAAALGLSAAAASAGPLPQVVQGDGRRAVLFVRTAAGIEARTVVVGISNWEITEVVGGLTEGEVILDVS